MLSAEPQCGSATAMKKDNVHGAKLGLLEGKKKMCFCTLTSLKKKSIQRIRCEIIEIVRRVAPPHLSLEWHQKSKVLKVCLFKVSLTVSPSPLYLYPVILLFLFSFHPSPTSLYLQWGASRARATPQSASTKLP